ncbi:FUSC family protein [Massilia terrae]|uniref:FUSC family protein n=1 Tax=Massilia terrae TaxID=1811224 RepID=A0ABT2D233_9BURK|nr:FUSC family protein [Massilia terrae]MCS0660282.1 FUSC family protein [Massilia terrae]
MGSTLRRPVLAAFNAACVTTLAASATLMCALALQRSAALAVLGVMLSLSLSRSELERERHGRFEAAVALPVVGLCAIGVGMLLHRWPLPGALLFTLAIALSIWLRRFGATAARIGSLAGLPFVALLVTPHLAPDPAGSVPAFMLPVLVGWLALFWVVLLHACARWAGVALPPGKPRPTALVGKAESSLWPDASTRLALQMAASLALSFAVGFAIFPERWSWIVVTAFIVASGNRGRLDVAYKSVLRVGGAAAGTLLALVLGEHAGGHGAATAVLIMAALFVGTWLRPFAYAWWALCVTIAFALLQGFTGASPAAMLWARLEEIVIGAALAVACAWLLLPVRSSGVLRRRLAVALAALSDAFDPGKEPRWVAPFVAALEVIEHMAPAFRAARVLTSRFVRVQPADWIDLLLACREPACALFEAGQAPPEVRRAIGAARQALREPEELAVSLRALQSTLAAQFASLPRQTEPAP